MEEEIEYTHLGICNYTKKSFCKKNIQGNINKIKYALYSLIGCSMRKTTLTPRAISNIYWSVAVPKLMSGCEVKYYCPNELKEYEKAHRAIAKDIQLLPDNAPDPVCLAALGWHKIQSYVDKAKLLFVWRLLFLPSESVFRKVFILRLFQVLFSGIYTTISPTAQIAELCIKYNIINYVKTVVQTGILPSRIVWKKMITKVIYDKEFSTWRLDLKLYTNLTLFRTIILQIEPCVWWDIAKNFRFLKKACCTMLRLLCGCNGLRLYKDVDVNRAERYCLQCNLNCVEDVKHFVMKCHSSADIRQAMFENIFSEISADSRITMHSLSDDMVFYVLMGLDFPISGQDRNLIRVNSAFHINTMYKQRMSSN